MTSQGPYDQRTIFKSLDVAWSLLRTFPAKQLKKISQSSIDTYYYADDDLADDPKKEGADKAMEM